MSEAKPKRRLPMVSGNADESDPLRPAWHFIVITALTMLLTWILLAWMVNAALASRVRAGGADIYVTIANLVAYFASAFAAAALTGHYGGNAGRREARIGGALTALLGWSVPFTWFALYSETSFRSGAVAWLLLLVAMIAVALGATSLGFWVTRRRISK